MLEEAVAANAAAPTVHAPPPSSCWPAADTARPRVLVVEDVREQALILRRWLEMEGCDVVVAHDGATGLALAQRSDFDLVITDIQVPGADGVDIARQSKNAVPWRPVVAMTAHLEDDVAELRVHASELLVKPLKRVPTATMVRQLLEQAREGRAAEEELASAVASTPPGR